ncbi:MAG TPA: ribonuclease H-like domain-containing protein, partial [Phototrophicaceae bacterium]|nr:ribonuclease H-like domain-containing protein [Phototrophicaceae bacterium]
CPGHSACAQPAAVQHDSARLPGLSRLTWEHLHREGLHQLEHILENTPDDLRRIKGIGRARALDLLAFAEAVIQQMPVMRGSLPEVARSLGVMLDLETRLDDGQVWCFGWQGADGRFQAAIVDRYFEGDKLQLPDGQMITIIENSDEGWRLVAEAAQQLPGPVYHWGNFEKGVLRATAPADVIEILDTRLHDLNRTFKQTCMLPVRGTSIKKVAPYLGFHWPEGSNVFAAWGDYNVWLRDGNADALARACAYNRADVEALAIIWQWLLDNSP